MTSPNFPQLEPQLNSILECTVAQIQADLAEAMPAVAPRLHSWMRQLARSEQPADYFRQPIGFPLLQLPWWLATSLGVTAEKFLDDVVYSTLNGYYYIRLLDNVMDGHGSSDVALLPAASFFHTRFQTPYQTHFPAQHPFWQKFQHTWFRAAEITIQDAGLASITLEQFKEISGHKVSAIHIPLAAICWHAYQPQALAPWLAFANKLSTWHQFWNDVFDWSKDLRFNTTTYFLSEAERRKTENETITAWVAREGFAWGTHVLNDWLLELKQWARPLNSSALLGYLDFRQRLLAEQALQLQADLQQLARLATAFGRRESV